MALFEALGELVGSAVLSTAPAFDLPVQPEAAKRYAEFANWLQTRNSAQPLHAIMDALAREIWVGAETRGLSQNAIESHVRAVGSIVARHAPSPAHLAQAIERARTGITGTAGTGESAARRIALDILGRARAAGAIDAAGLRDEIALFIMDRVFAHLLDDPQVLQGLRPEIAAFAAAPGTPAGTAAPAAGALAALGLAPVVVAALEAAGGAALLADLRERYGLAEKAMQRLLALVDQQAGSPAEIVPRLEELAAWLGDVKAQLQRPSNEDPELRRLKTKAAAALGEGDFEAAAEALRQVRRQVREGRRRIEERLAEEVVGLKSQMIEEARATGRLAELALAGRDYAAAAELFAEAAQSLPTVDRDGAWRYSVQRAETLLRQGDELSDPAALAEAIAAYGQAVRMVADGSNQKGLGQASLGLGHALALAGERETGAARLKDAAAAYRKAINLIGRDGDSRSFGLAHLRLARALALQGEREQSSAVLREAAQAFRDALREIKADRFAADATAARIGLGNALLALEEREGGAPLLAEAADAFAAALAGLDRGHEAPLWAEAQKNLGLSLLGLGEQQGASDRLEGAVAAFGAALEVYTRQADPARWALVHLNLGNALAALGDRTPDDASRLVASIAAYNAALEEFRRDSEPLKWAIAQMNLGTALIRLGERREKRRNWLAAAGALVPALEVFETEGADAYADVTRRNLRRFHESWDSLIAAPAPSSAESAKPRLTKAG